MAGEIPELFSFILPSVAPKTFNFNGLWFSARHENPAGTQFARHLDSHRNLSRHIEMAVFRLGQNWNHSFRDLEREVDQLLKGVQATFQGLRCGRQYPPVNVFELDDEFLLTAELPGVRVEDVDLTISAGVLTIRGLRIEDKAPADSSFRRQERAFGSWQRSLTLPDRVVEEGLAAELTNGILRIHLPKAPLEAARQIPVSEG